MIKIKMESKNVNNKEIQERMKKRKNDGITLIALVITVIMQIIIKNIF
mgnify:CR=1 FL=1